MVPVIGLIDISIFLFFDEFRVDMGMGSEKVVDEENYWAFCFVIMIKRIE